MTSISRREALKRAAQVAVATGLPFSFTAASGNETAPWLVPKIPPVTAQGYGTDPNLIHPAPAPWPNTLTIEQRQMLTLLVDLILPADGTAPSASQVGVVDVLDEWVSAPYPDQQTHRHAILTGLFWLDAQARVCCGEVFAKASEAQRIRIIDSIAYPERIQSNDLLAPARFFALLRQLTVGAFYTSPEGIQELGYIGNVPIAGDYPGPDEAAMAHLQAQLKALGLEE